MRNNLNNTFINDTKEYQEFRKKRKLPLLRQYTTPHLKTVSRDDYNQLTLIPHTWKTGDRLYKLAFEYYGDSSYWWLIALFNEKPTEFHFKVGELLYIPLSLEQTLLLVEYK